MPDPKLRAAQEEIKAILRKYDITGVIVVSSKTHTDFQVEIEATWNAIRVVDGPQGMGIRFRCNAESHPDLKARGEAARLSLSTLLGTVDAMNAVMEGLNTLLIKVGERIPFDHRSDFEGGTSARF